MISQPVGSWHHLEDWTDLTACKCQSVGYLVKDDQDIKAIAQNIADMHDDDLAQASGVITIPNKCIEKMVELISPTT